MWCGFIGVFQWNSSGRSIEYCSAIGVSIVSFQVCVMLCQLFHNGYDDCFGSRHIIARGCRFEHSDLRCFMLDQCLDEVARWSEAVWRYDPSG